MRIGILVKNSNSIFTNGCLQQGYFLLKTFRKLGYSCNFVSATSDFTNFEVVNEDIHPLKSSEDLDNYNILVFSSGSIDNSSYMSYCKLNNIKMINLCVGNYYIINQEEFVFGVHKSNDVMKRMYNKFVDRIWLMPMYSHNINYMKYITKAPLDISPYVWDSTFIDEYSKSKKLNLMYNPKLKKLDVLILEPNVSTHKTALVPLLICETFYRLHPDKLGKIYMFCKPKSEFKEKLWYLDIFRNNRVEFFERVICMDLFDNLNNLGKKYTVLSSNIRNGLNFLHLECFKLGIPIIHNCKPFQTSGLYFQEDDNCDDYPSAVKHLLSVYNNTYTQNGNDILNRYNPYNSKNMDGYKQLIESIYRPATPVLNQIIGNLANNSNSYKLNDKVAIVFLINKKDELSTIVGNINRIKAQGFVCNFYIADKYNILDSKPTDIYNVVNLTNYKYTLQEIYTKILHKNIILVSNNYTIQFDLREIIDKGDIVGIEIEKDKDMNSSDFDFYKSIIDTVQAVIKKNYPVKIFDTGVLFLRNDMNIINGVKNVKRVSGIDDFTFSNILFHLYYSNKVSLVHKKLLLYSDEQTVIGKGYSNNSLILFYKCIDNTQKKVVIENDNLYNFMCN